MGAEGNSVLLQRTPDSLVLIRVVVVNDNPLMLEWLVSVLEKSNRITVVAQESDSFGAVRACVKLKPDVTILSWQLDNVPSAVIAQLIRTQDPQARFIVLSTLDKRKDIIPALPCDIVGYLAKDSSPEEIVTCVERVHAGHSHLGPIERSGR
jgi:DNA-binding NarL/FixJ family response regulator